MIYLTTSSYLLQVTSEIPDCSNLGVLALRLPKRVCKIRTEATEFNFSINANKSSCKLKFKRINVLWISSLNGKVEELKSYPINYFVYGL